MKVNLQSNMPLMQTSYKQKENKTSHSNPIIQSFGMKKLSVPQRIANVILNVIKKVKNIAKLRQETKAVQDRINQFKGLEGKVSSHI